MKPMPFDKEPAMKHRDMPVFAAPTRVMRKAALCIAVFGLAAALGGCGGGDDSKPSTAGSRIAYRPAEVAQAARVLTGDAGSGRCPDDTQPCYQDNDDILNGQRRVLRIEDIAVAARTYSDVTPGETHFAGGIAITANSEVSSTTKSAPTGFAPLLGISDPLALGARLFAGGREALVSAIAGPTLSVAVTTNAGSVNGGVGTGVPQGTDLAALFGAKADFTGDGFEEVVLATLALTGQKVSGMLQVMSAQNTNDSGAGLRAGAALAVDGMLGVAAGNFFGDGPVAVIAVAPPDGSLRLQYYAIDRTSLALSPLPAKTLTLARPAGGLPLRDASLAVGRFNTVLYDQLLIAAADLVRIELLSVDKDANAMPVQRLSGISAVKPGFRGVLRAGRFDWASPFDSVAYLVTDIERAPSPAGDRFVEMLTLDANLDVASQSPAVTLANGQCVYDMQAGNFDRRDPDPTPNAPAGATIHNANLQLAFATSTATLHTPANTCTAYNGAQGDEPGSFFISIWDVVVNDNAAPDQRLLLQQHSDFAWYRPPPSMVFLDNDTLLDVSLAVVDLQGRSLTLGPPQVVTIERRTQPSVVVAAPPMHADFVDGELFNFSMAPDGFNVRYTTSSDSTVSTTTKHTTTWSWTSEESFRAQASYGPCGLACQKLDFKASAKQALDGATKSTNKTYKSISAEVAATTFQFDRLLVQDSALTLYVYPVLGQTVCPSGAASCADADRVPLTLTIAAPDSVTNPTFMDATTATWYQPPWMPGNLLSYPGTLGQLMAAAQIDSAADFNAMTDPVKFQTGADTEQKVTWKTSGTDGTETTLNQNYSFKTSLSLTESVGTKAVASASFSAGLNLGGSFGFKNLSDSTTTLAQSVGWKLAFKGDFPDAHVYGYYYTPYIFSSALPADAQSVAAAGGNQAFGVLQSGYVVDPLSIGTIWHDSRKLYSAAPDVAFNQPMRFSVESPKTSPGDDDRCIEVGGLTSFNCVEINEPAPEDPWTDEYHTMRGFFITQAAANGQGPQLGSINAGETLLLQARVHNFSTAAMAGTHRVRVGFYGMRWDTSDNTPIGESFYIGTAETGPVPPFSTIAGAPPNWSLVSQTFDTSGRDNQDLVFWAVTWIDDGSSKPVDELPGKGLKQIPQAGGLQFADAAALEEEHGNNVGFYNQVFHVFSPASATAVRATVPATRPSLQITEAGSSDATVAAGERAIVGARVVVGENDLKGGLSVVFYDGDPKAGGRAIGMHSVPHLSKGRSYEFVLPFRSRECGAHRIHAVTAPGTRFEHSVVAETVTVDCERTSARRASRRAKNG